VDARIFGAYHQTGSWGRAKGLSRLDLVNLFKNAPLKRLTKSTSHIAHVPLCPCVVHLQRSIVQRQHISSQVREPDSHLTGVEHAVYTRHEGKTDNPAACRYHMSISVLLGSNRIPSSSATSDAATAPRQRFFCDVAPRLKPATGKERPPNVRPARTAAIDAHGTAKKRCSADEGEDGVRRGEHPCRSRLGSLYLTPSASQE
jgi:hypothetical protein